MPKAQRFPIKDNEDVGPGQYTIPGSIGLIPKYHFEKNKDHIDVSKIGKFWIKKINIYIQINLVIS